MLLYRILPSETPPTMDSGKSACWTNEHICQLVTALHSKVYILCIISSVQGVACSDSMQCEHQSGMLLHLHVICNKTHYLPEPHSVSSSPAPNIPPALQLLLPGLQ